LAHQMAIEFPHVTADVIEANEFPELSQRYGVSGVPMTIINDKVEFTGAVPEPYFLAAIRQALGIPHPAETESDDEDAET
jgi:predicted DsbA family dithiol-disulfide isomerase